MDGNAATLVVEAEALLAGFLEAFRFETVFLAVLGFDLRATVFLAVGWAFAAGFAFATGLALAAGLAFPAGFAFAAGFGFAAVFALFAAGLAGAGLFSALAGASAAAGVAAAVAVFSDAAAAAWRRTSAGLAVVAVGLVRATGFGDAALGAVSVLAGVTGLEA